MDFDLVKLANEALRAALTIVAGLVLAYGVAGRLPNATSSEIVDTALEVLKPMVAKSSEFALLQDAIMRLTAEMEQSKLSFQQVRTFATRPAVQSIVKALEDQYGPSLRSKESGDEA